MLQEKNPLGMYFNKRIIYGDCMTSYSVMAVKGVGGIIEPTEKKLDFTGFSLA